MTTEVLTQAVTAGTQVTFGQGRMFYLKTASGKCAITCERQGSGATVRKFTGCGAGFKFLAPVGEGWDYLRLTDDTSETIEIIVGEDDVELANAVSIAGTASVHELQPTGITASVADTSVASGAAATVAANANRKNLVIGALSTNTGSIRVQSVGAGANKGAELQPGQTLRTTYTGALDVRNDSAAAQAFYTFEET